MKLGLTQDRNICNIALDDEEAVSALATALDLPPSEIRNLIVFAQQVLMNAEARLMNFSTGRAHPLEP